MPTIIYLVIPHELYRSDLLIFLVRRLAMSVTCSMDVNLSLNTCSLCSVILLAFVVGTCIFLLKSVQNSFKNYEKVLIKQLPEQF